MSSKDLRKATIILGGIALVPLLVVAVLTVTHASEEIVRPFVILFVIAAIFAFIPWIVAR